jgi:hypothetical protein
MKIINYDAATRILHLSLEIKHLVELYWINKEVVIEDFKDLINSEFEKEKFHEDN